jgi:hypothetical protein
MSKRQVGNGDFCDPEPNNTRFVFRLMLFHLMHTYLTNLVVVPMKFIIIGSDFSPLSERLLKSNLGQEMSHEKGLEITPNEYALDLFINALWSNIRAKTKELDELGLTQSGYQTLFNDKNFQDNINKIKQGFLPQARAILGAGDATLSDLLQLRPLSKTWPGPCPAVYIRIYTNGGESPDHVSHIGIYVGKTNNLHQRQLQHESALRNGDSSPHYSRARTASPENRHIMPLCV